MSVYKLKTQPYNGVFIELAGPDGCGKTTNARVLTKHFRDQGADVIITREPGGTPLAEELRSIVLSYQEVNGEKMHGLTEMMIFGAARAQHLAEKIIPALQAGKVVICDRFALSTRAYQGHGRGLLSAALQMEKTIHPNLSPDYVLNFQLPFEMSLERGRVRNQAANYGDRFEDADLEFKQKVYDGFGYEIETLKMRDPLGVIDVDATQTLADIDIYLLGVAVKIIRDRSLVAAP